jgi:NADPH-dependent glutamate synthase beta subunit-like oxidoreductase/NAD(P)H-flavin reductase
MSKLKLGLPGLGYPDLRTVAGLQKLDELFLQRLTEQDADLARRLQAYRDGEISVPLETSELLLACAPVLEEFIAELFGIREAMEELLRDTLSHDPIFAFKKLFVLRRARRRLMKKDVDESFAELDAWLANALEAGGLTDDDRELAIARYGQQLLDDKDNQADAIEMLTRWCVRALTLPEGQDAVRGWVSFRLPQPVDHNALVPTEPVPGDQAGRTVIPIHRYRDGFGLTDPRMNQRAVQGEVDYCIYCHDHDGDFCSKGFPVKKGEPEQGYKTNPLGVDLVGCPLDEKISEMHLLKKEGHTLAALTMIMVDNPMVPATGHRICNDCMKACVYQKQDAVNIPQIETRVLTDVLNLPWGVEIYDLLTRWNPLRREARIAKPYNGLKVLIAGMGPAGFTLAHYLTLEGFAVVGIDGLKIEPLPQELIDQPIRNYSDIQEKLDQRILAGFGGVAEYGITVRWDKNFLKLIYLTLMRRPRFQVFGGVRFGGTLTVEQAWDAGFDHLAIAVGAGLPQALPIPGSLAPGMRMAADFLMALQLTGAAKDSSLANLQVRLPAVVIGGGLTGVDAATEVQAYYLVQIEKILHRYEILVKAYGEKNIREGLDPLSLTILDEYLEHGRAVRAERKRAASAGEEPKLHALAQQWGGVTIAYRRRMQDSPAYLRNHEEVIKAMEEGVMYGEGLSPKAARLDADGQVDALLCERVSFDAEGKPTDEREEIELPARTVLVATGAKPNIAYYFEHRGTFELNERNYQTNRFENGALQPVPVAPHVKDAAFGAFTSYDRDGHRVSFIGDTHPVFNGNVVKAIASGMRIYGRIIETFGERAHASGDENEYVAFRQTMEEQLQARVVSVERLTPQSVEVTVRAPLAAKRYQPAQMFRLQNYETLSPLVEGTRLQTETLVLTGSRVDPEAGTVSVIVRERGASSRLCATLRPGDPLILMGPGGNKSLIPENETVLVAGDWLAAVALRSLGPAYKARGNRVLFMVSLPNADELFCREELETCTDSIVWVTESGRPVESQRAQDAAATGDLAEVMLRYARGELTSGTPAIPFEQVDHIHITADRLLLRAIQEARRGPLAQSFARKPKVTGSVYSSMQCMLKGVCSQCLQWQVDPATGERTKAVFACSWQDEPLDLVDLQALTERLSQNRLQEHLANRWLDYLLEHGGVERV